MGFYLQCNAAKLAFQFLNIEHILLKKLKSLYLGLIHEFIILG